VIRYKTKREPPWIIAVGCEEPNYPHKDSDGEVQFVNTHFDTAEQAWEHLLESVSLAQSLAVGDWVDAKAHLEEKKNKLAERAATHTLAAEAFDEWKASRKETP
jgi:hypothetical protein